MSGHDSGLTISFQAKTFFTGYSFVAVIALCLSFQEYLESSNVDIYNWS